MSPPAPPRLPLSRDRIVKDLHQLADLPSLSPVVAQLTATLNRPDVELHEVEVIIRRDPIIAAKVISAANAAAYAGLSATTSIRGALMKLGLLRVRRLAVLISLYNALPRHDAFQEAFWRHSLAVAHGAEVVTRHLPAAPAGANLDAVFLAGLLHDLGLLVLSNHYPKHASLVSSHAASTGLPLYEAELAVLGIDHGEIGACLAEYWAFPPETCAPIRFHHRPAAAPAAYRWPAAIIRLADAICMMEPTWDLGESGGLAEDESTLADLGLKAESLPGMVTEIRAEAERATQALGGSV